jgi:hypothetical protein
MKTESHLVNISNYFRQSLLDSDRSCPPDDSVLPSLGLAKSKKKQSENRCFAVDSIDLVNGGVDQETTDKIFKIKEDDLNSKKEGVFELNQVEITVFPRVDLLQIKGSKPLVSKKRVLLPVVIVANIQRNGRLVATKKSPWIPREWLAPNESESGFLGELMAVDNFLTHNPFEGIEEWTLLIKFCIGLLSSVKGVRIDESKIGPDLLLRLSLHDDYERSSQSIILVDSPVIETKRKIIAILENICESKQANALYNNYVSLSSKVIAPISLLQWSHKHALKHVGQMTGEFPLSPNQRNALHFLFDQDHGNILAVNGPPGTGKTTLLRSVVATMWTNAALKNEVDPPIIVAASNNNQAVTNILESFSRIDERGVDSLIQGRWIPDIQTYGLYFCSQTKVNSKPTYRFLGPNNEGLLYDIQTRDYVETARIFFLKKANEWKSNQLFKAINDVRIYLHKVMITTHNEISDGFKVLSLFQVALNDIKTHFGSIEKIDLKLSQWTLIVDQISEEIEKCQCQLDRIYALWENRSWWEILLSFLPPIRKIQNRKNIRLLNKLEIECDSSDDTIEDYFYCILKKKKTLKEKYSTKIEAMNNLKQRYIDSKSKLDEWIRYHQPTVIISNTLEDKVHEICDRNLRFKLFKLATHYWEARWLSETKQFLDNRDEDKKSPKKLMRKYRRFAKLTPCFVATFFMVPSFFTAFERKEDAWKDIPLFDEIDLLIVDESGQALADVASASFALAKRALVVGDTDQIEPVWNIPSSIDRANLELFKLLTTTHSYDKFWLNSGLLSSSGNLMRVAQRQCKFHQFDILQRGLYLTEHRRCYNDIIRFWVTSTEGCNFTIVK